MSQREAYVVCSPTPTAAGETALLAESGKIPGIPNSTWIATVFAEHDKAGQALLMKVKLNASCGGGEQEMTLIGSMGMEVKKAANDDVLADDDASLFPDTPPQPPNTPMTPCKASPCSRNGSAFQETPPGAPLKRKRGFLVSGSGGGLSPAAASPGACRDSQSTVALDAEGMENAMKRHHGTQGGAKSCCSPASSSSSSFWKGTPRPLKASWSRYDEFLNSEMNR